jgi:hypothetical protein
MELFLLCRLCSFVECDELEGISKGMVFLVNTVVRSSFKVNNIMKFTVSSDSCSLMFTPGEVHLATAEGKTCSWSSEGPSSLQAHVLRTGTFTQWWRRYFPWCPEVSTIHCDYYYLHHQGWKLLLMSVLTRATWRHIPEDGFLHGHCHENLKSYLFHLHYKRPIS